MARLIGQSQQYDNPYEQARYELQGSPLFDNNLWDTKAKQGRLPEYATVLYDAIKNLNYSKFSTDSAYSHLKGEARYNAMINELYEDREKVKTFTDTYTDQYDQQRVESFTGTQYEYNKRILSQLNEQAKQQELLDIEARQKAELGQFKLLLGDIAATAGEFTEGFLSQIENMMIAPIAQMSTGIAYVTSGAGSFLDGVRAAADDNSDVAFSHIGSNALRDALLEFERKYSHFMDVDGTQKWIGKFLSGTANSIGKMVPSMIMSQGSLGRVNNTAGKLYWVGLAEGDFSELASNPDLASVPTATLMSNVAISTTMEWAISEMLTMVMGATFKDNLVYGHRLPDATNKATTKLATLSKVAQRIMMSAIHEGTEEILQEYSSYIIDRMYGLFYDNFNNVSEWNFETMLDAFLMGAFSSIIIGGFDFVTTKRETSSEFKKTKTGEIRYKNGEPVFKKMSLLQSYALKMDVRSMFQYYDDVVNDKNSSDTDRNAALLSMYQTYKVVTDYYGEIGSKRFKAAQELLQEMYNQNRTSKEIADAIANDFKKIGMQLDAREKAELLAKANNANATEIEKVFDKAIDAAEMSTELADKIMKIVKADSKIDEIYTSETGNDLVVQNNILIVPKNYLKLDDGSDIIKNLAEKRLVENAISETANNARFASVINSLTKLYRQVRDIYEASTKVATDQSVKQTLKTDNVSDTELTIYSLLFDENFYRLALYNSYDDVVYFLAQLDNIVDIKGVKDAEFKDHYDAVRKARKNALIDYIANQQNFTEDRIAQLQQTKVLNKEDIERVRRRRWTKDLANRIIAGEKLSKADNTVLLNRINALPITQELKTKLLSELGNSDRKIRYDAIVKLDNYYNNAFLGPFNGRVLPLLNTIQSQIFANLLINKDITMNDIRAPKKNTPFYNELVAANIAPNADNAFNYIKTIFEVSTNDKYTLEYNKETGQIYAIEKTIEQERGYKKLSRTDVYSGDNIENRTFINYHIEKDTVIDTVLNPDIDARTKKFITLKDVMYDSSLLNEETQNKIQEQYGKISAQTTFLYLRKYYLDKTGTVSVVMLPGQRFALVDVKPMLDSLKNKSITIDDVKDGSLLADYVNNELLTKDIGMKTKIKFGNEIGYNDKTNVITLDKNAMSNQSYFRFALLHEFQHVIQTQNGMTLGINQFWLENAIKKKQMTIAQKNKLVADIRAHNEDLFDGIKKNSKEELRIAQKYIYDTSAEYQAMGLESIQDVIDFVPTSITYEGNKTILTTAWGTRYQIGDSPASLFYSKNDHRFDAIIDVIRNDPDLVKYDSERVRKGFIFPNGDIRFLEDQGEFEHHYDVITLLPSDIDDYLAGFAYINDALQITIDNIYIDASGKQTFNGAAPRYTVRLTDGILTAQTKEALLKFMDRAQKDGHIVTLADAHGRTLVNSDKWGDADYPEEVFKEYEKQRVRDRMYHGTQVSHNYEYMFWAGNYQFAIKEIENKLSNKVDIKFEKNDGGYDLTQNSTRSIYIGATGEIFSSDMWYAFDKIATKFNETLKNKTNIMTALKSTMIEFNIMDSMTVINTPASITNSQRSVLSTIIDKIVKTLPQELISNGYSFILHNTALTRYGLDSAFYGAFDAKEIIEIPYANKGQSYAIGDYMRLTDAMKDIHAFVSQDNDMSLARQPGDRSKVTVDETRASKNLESFKGKPLTEDTKSFISEADPALIAPELWSQINGDEAGTLTYQSVMQYFRETNLSDMNEYTFDLIRKHFFPDSTIESKEELSTIISFNSYAYALKKVLEAYPNEDVQLMHEEMNFDTIVNLYNTLLDNNERIGKQFRKDVQYYEDKVSIDEQAAKILYMEQYDGSPLSAYIVASKLKSGEYKLEASRKVSTDVAITSDKDGNTKTLGDKLSDKRSAEDVYFEDDLDDELNAITYDLDNYSKRDKLEIMFRYEMVDFIKKEAKGRTINEDVMLKYKDKYISKLLNKPIDEINARFLVIQRRIAQGDFSAIKDSEIAEQTILVRKRQNVITNARRLATNIRKRLSADAMRVFKEINPDIFDENDKLNQDLYKGKTQEEIYALEERVRELAALSKKHAYDSKASFERVKRLERDLKRYQKKLDKANVELGKKNKVEYVFIYDNEYQITTSAEMPAALQSILRVNFEKTAKSRTQFLTTEDQRHVKVSAKEFLANAAEYLNALTQSDVDDIIKFYKNSVPLSGLTETGARKYDAFKLFILGYITERAKLDGMYELSAEQQEAIKNTVENTVSDSAQILIAWRDSMKMFDPAKEITMSLARKYGLEAREADVDNLMTAIRNREGDSIKQARKEMYQHMVEDYKLKDKNVFSLLWKFERMAMLSSPGTWVRNLSSNLLVTIGNDVSGMLGNLFTKKWHKEGQYKITGTKVTSEVRTFIQDVFVDSGFIASVVDVASKYDERRIGRKRAADVVVDMISQAMAAEIQMNNQFKSKSLNTVNRWLMKMLSDDKFITKRAIYYMSRMLTEDGIDVSKFDISLIETLSNENKTVRDKRNMYKDVTAVTDEQSKTKQKTKEQIDTENKVTSAVLTTFAEAYRMAAMDYMHKANFFNRIEDVIAEKTGKAGYFLYKQLLPFASASWNWFVEGLNYTPLGLAKGIWELVKLEKTIESLEAKRQKGTSTYSSRFAEYVAKRNIGKGIIGSITLGIGALLAAFGIIRLDDKDDQIKLYIGDEVSIDFSNVFGTQGFFLGAVIGMAIADDDINFKQAIINFADAFFADSTFSDVFNTFRYSDSFGEWLLAQPESFLSSFIPNAWKAIMSTTYNSKLKYSSGIKGVGQRLAVQLGGGAAVAAFKIPKRIDPYTGKTTLKYKVPFIMEFWNKMTPLKIYAYEVSDYEKEAIKLGISKGQLSGNYKDIGQMSDADVRKLNEYYGQLNEKDLQKLMSNKEKYSVEMKDGSYKELKYSEMTNEQKKNVINRIMTNNAKLAKIYVWTSAGHKYYASNSEYDKLKTAGIKNNVYKQSKKFEGFIS